MREPFDATSSMREEYAQNGLPPPDEDDARDQCLRASMAAPDLATVKVFLRFYASTSQPLFDAVSPTTDSLQTIAEWFFAGFTNVTGTEIENKERSELYYVRVSSEL
ncbi:hypothetical protein PV10_01783 [Exophiala mesophila]|uniref:Uncharacterized protein n=1 Tax=Exophiala mesophila TaxID=212818 RepID=A0A0D1YBS2_EXOME|nr:uncharacterized protein PV10_01783 [Exophiala mesophila]KIV98096.1 hypothetical protein PV10_01783 [Exophiala mesophila]